MGWDPRGKDWVCLRWGCQEGCAEKQAPVAKVGSEVVLLSFVLFDLRRRWLSSPLCCLGVSWGSLGWARHTVGPEINIELNEPRFPCWSLYIQNTKVVSYIPSINMLHGFWISKNLLLFVLGFFKKQFPSSLTQSDFAIPGYLVVHIFILITTLRSKSDCSPSNRKVNWDAGQTVQDHRHASPFPLTVGHTTSKHKRLTTFEILKFFHKLRYRFSVPE